MRGESLEEPILCGGTVTWRRTNEGYQVLLVHSAGTAGWGWPKGHLDPGETLHEAAQRETFEETGISVRLHLPLCVETYQVPERGWKAVHYWLATPLSDAWGEIVSPVPKEISHVQWFSLPEAAQTLRYPSQLQVLHAFEDALANGKVGSQPLIVLRHAQAVSRKEWSGKEQRRPLTIRGIEQANRIGSLLSVWQPNSIVTSPATRCAQTVEPFMAGNELAVLERSTWSEEVHGLDPASVWAASRELLTGGCAVLCTHRPVLPTIIDAWSVDNSEVAQDFPSSDPYLRPGAMLVVHRSGQQILGIEIVDAWRDLPDL